MTEHFHVFAKAVRKQFDALSKEELFVVNSDREAIWIAYLLAFPEGSDPIFRKRTEHDCGCCKGFIRGVGNVVAIRGTELITVWDITGLPHPYQAVADGMAAYVKGLAVRDIFLTKFAKYGVEKNLELIDGRTHQWSHFSADIPAIFVHREPDARRGDVKTAQAMLLRAVSELTPAALATVADLIKSNAIYRGKEFERAVKEFTALAAKFHGINDPELRARMAWTLANNPAARFKNTVIGTLVADLSEGTALEEAVRVYELKVAPQNYKRSTALISRGMVEAATKTIAELGLEDSLERRHARLSDVSVESVLFVNNAAQGEMRGGVKGLLMQEVKPVPFDPKRAEEITVDAFMATVLPKVSDLKLYMENQHAGHFVSMTAPAHDDTKGLFQWSNNFAWSYDGDVTDSIKEKVKRAGGRVENVALRVSLAWYNFDDLDLHCVVPGGQHIYYGQKSGILDVDMNAHGQKSRSAVENMRWINMPYDGVYKFYVNQFNRRESVDLGFEVELESAAGVHHFQYGKGVTGNVTVFDLTMKDGRITAIKPGASIVTGTLPQEKWGLKTQELVRVNSVVLSPNYWAGEAVGNKHWFFLLEGCLNPESVRGIYNEFLSYNLQAHRKVFEVLGDKTKCPPAAEQLSGLGFSSTKEDRVTVVAMGPSLNKAYTIVFGR